MIEGVVKTPLKQIQDARGKVMHMLKVTDPNFQKFGEVYFSWVNPGYIKGWKKHRISTMNFAVPVGVVKVAIFDDYPASKSYKCVEEFILSYEDYYLLTIPPGLWYGFKAEGIHAAMIVNCATYPHDPNEAVTLEPYDPSIPYIWEG